MSAVDAFTHRFPALYILVGTYPTRCDPLTLIHFFAFNRRWKWQARKHLGD